MENTEVVIENPAGFLKSLRKKALVTADAIKNRSKEIKSLKEKFRESGTTLLYRNNTLRIEGYCCSGIIPSPSYLISGVEIYCRPFDNNCLNENIHCGVDIFLQLIIDYDYDKNDWFKNEPKLEWGCLLPSFRIFENPGANGKYGVLTKPNNGGWYNEIAIKDFTKFDEFRKVFAEGLKQIGYITK